MHHHVAVFDHQPFVHHHSHHVGDYSHHVKAGECADLIVVDDNGMQQPMFQSTVYEHHLAARGTIDLSHPSSSSSSVTIPTSPFSSWTHGKTSDGTTSDTTCVGIPFFNDCTTVTNHPNGSHTYTDSTTVGPYTWDWSFKY